tara:strand:+ start:356 stop:883 length:528 start_codon:yes stop_codon:yes gene_type:complete
MTDGRCTSGNEIISEDHQKFVLLSENRFIAYGGDKDRCELVVRAMQELGHVQRELEDSARHMAGLIQNIGQRGFELFMATGGFGPIGAEVYGFSTKSHQPTILKPNSDELRFVLLSSDNVCEQDLNTELVKLIKKYGDTNPAEVQKAQVDLNSWVAQVDRTVNTTIFSRILRAST